MTPTLNRSINRGKKTRTPIFGNGKFPFGMMAIQYQLNKITTAARTTKASKPFFMWLTH
jgi:hypothetical protein